MNLQHTLYNTLEGSHWMDNERYFSCFCPFESHERPALLVYSDGFYCMSCEKRGSLQYLEQNVSNLPAHRPVIQKYSILPRWRKWENKYGDIPEIAKAAHKFLIPDRAGYLRKRKVAQFINKGMFGLLDGWYTFPVFDEHHSIVDIVVRAGDGKGNDVKYVLKAYDEKVVRPLYCPDWDKVLKNSHIFVCYGILDVWSFEAIGLPAVTGITGKSINPVLFDRFIDKNFIVVPDRGEEKNAYRLAESLGWRGSVRRIDWPYGIKDPDELRRNITKQEFRKMFEGEWDNGLV